MEPAALVPNVLVAATKDVLPVELDANVKKLDPVASRLVICYDVSHDVCMDCMELSNCMEYN